MYSLSELQDIVSQSIAEKKFPQEPHLLYEPITYFLRLGGKRLRPVLTLMASDLFAVDIKPAIPVALAIEVFHNFTLMHDDIMDKAPLRRGQPTVHEKWTVNTAILSGDAMMILSYQLLAEVPQQYLYEVLRVFNKMVLEVCEGQQYDMEFESRESVSEDEYIQMIRLKTSVLIGTALKIGAILANAPAEDVEHIYDFGVNMGIAFQIQDDILDVYGDPSKFGKQVGGDILENKKTWLLIKAMQLATGEKLGLLQSWISNRNPHDAEEKVKAITAIYDQLEIKQQAEKLKNTFADRAYQALEQIKAPEQRKQALKVFAAKLLIREN
ncbi:polyprenyl synthetase family protein [Olivibacter sitiensis]|uniref:polyprenyl synthetase family protein n=1 Tax=Olivibacter sitiensis TaxID=376470 RepID=UPI00041A0499|nr:polyprenyl synthetase family protein [Olivibacter sitiensis]